MERTEQFVISIHISLRCSLSKKLDDVSASTHCELLNESQPIAEGSYCLRTNELSL